MNILVHSPYLPKHFGGGEKYMWDVVLGLRDLGHHVVVSGQNKITADDIKKYQTFLGVDLSGIETDDDAVLAQGTWYQRLWWSAQFDVVYYVTDGSVFFSLASKNILHIQVPLMLNKSSVKERLKLSRWSVINTNSVFTRRFIESSWGVNVSMVHHPVVETKLLTEVEMDQVIKHKEPIILSVGRIFRQLHSKRQDVLIQAFRHFIKTNPSKLRGWKLVLIGSVEDVEYFDTLKALAKGLPVEFITHVDRSGLLEWYRRAQLYWHAAGFEVEEVLHPEQVEHFGISTAEAMTMGCVPLVVGKGGQVEVLGSELEELLWQSLPELVDKSNRLISHPDIRIELAHKAWNQAQRFGRTRFNNQLQVMLK